MGFKKDLETIILEKIGNIGVKIDYDNIHELLRQYYNIKIKMIEVKKYEVNYSKELKLKMDFDEYKSDLKFVEECFEKGKNINKHLGRGSLDPGFQDGLLNDWGIYHLHLNSKNDSGSPFVKRSDWLLFFVVDEKSVYFIDVRHHKESRDKDNASYPLWFREEFIRIIKSNWKFLIEKFRLNGYTLKNVLSKDEIILMRKIGIVTFLNVDGEIYCSLGGGVTSGGKKGNKIGINQTLYANRLLNRISEWGEYIKEHPDDIKKSMEKNGFKPPNKLDFILLDHKEQGLIICEKNTSYSITLHNKYLKKL